MTPLKITFTNWLNQIPEYVHGRTPPSATDAHDAATRCHSRGAAQAQDPSLEELRKLKTHPTADELYQIVRQRLPRISLGTVYRNLLFLTESGQIAKLEIAGSTNRFDANMQPHQHVRCVCCGSVADIYSPVREPAIDNIQVPGFARILKSRVEYDGLCDACAATMASQEAAAYYPDRV